jgi:glycosyltransferase involved in cell wall biosynthesis
MRPLNPDTWVIIPVYNEATVIAQVLADLGRAFDNIVCVDDGSADGSADRILESRAHLVRHPVNLGQGAALQTGLTYALQRPGARYFVTFDADGQHRPEDAARMVEVARSENADVVLGSRFLGLGLTDAHNGLRVFTRPVVERLRIVMNDMAHASEIVSVLARSPWTVREVPVTIHYTEYSRSKGQSLLNGVNILFDLSVRSHR